MNQLEILPAKKPKNIKKYNIHEHLLQPSFNGLLIAPTCSGKSTIILNFLMNDFFYSKVFKKGNIYYFSPSVMLDETLKAVAEDEEITKFTDDDELSNADSILKALEESQKEKMKQDKEIEDMLIIYDDMLPYLKNNSYIGKLFTKSRHYKISCLLTSQHYTSIPLKCRNNAQMILISKLYNDSELEKINFEIGQNFKDFEKYYNICVNEPYGFIYCDLRHMRLYNKFQSLLWDKQEDLKKMKKLKNKINNIDELDRVTDKEDE